MRKSFIAFIVIGGLFAIGYYAYTSILSYTSSKIVEEVFDEELEIHLSEEREFKQSDLPFTTKEEALSVIVRKFSANELTEIAQQVKDGLTEAEKEALFAKYRDRFTDEEWQALLLIGRGALEEE